MKKSILVIALMSSIIVSLLLTISVAIAVPYIKEEKEPELIQLAIVSTFDELATAANNAAKVIKITDDIILTDTIYVPGVTTIEVDDSHTLIRDVNFLGDLFVVGENNLGENPILTSQAASLTLKANNGAILTIDGNSENIAETVMGTAFLISNIAELNMYDNIIIQDCKKLGNKSTNNYRVSYPDEIGGAAVIITSGAFNMYGGLISNCESSLDDSVSEVATQGGAIYNFGTFNMLGGKIANCKAFNGGAIYNYKISNIKAGEISNNRAIKYGGGIYNPNSQYANLNIGQDGADMKVLFKGNSTESSGGAIFSSIMASIYIEGATTFEENTAKSNGGAINSPGANVIKNATFIENEAGSKGGAIYAYHNKEENKVRHTILENIYFTSNIAKNGGALGVGSSTDNGIGAQVYVTNCLLNQNRSTEFGGAIYVTGGSTVTINDVVATENIAAKGGFLYLTTSGSTVKILSGKALDNVADTDCGSTIWTNSAKVILQIKGTTSQEYFVYNGEILGKGVVSEYEE